MAAKAEEKVEQAAQVPVLVAGTGSVVPVGLMDDVIADAAIPKDFTRDDLTIPFLVALQDLSPQVKKTKDKFIEGASAGMICNTVTEDLYDGEKGVLFVPVYFHRRHVEWTPRGDRTGSGPSLVRDYGADASILDRCTRDEKTGKLATPDGNDLVVSMEYFGLVYDEPSGSFNKCVINLSGTQFKKGRPWNTLISSLMIPHPADPNQRINPAIFYQAYRLCTKPESNESGDWYGWKITSECPVFSLPGGAPAYLEAREFRKMVASGVVKVAAVQGQEAEVQQERSRESTGGGSSHVVDDDEIPF
jgi:hypothetical protein